MLWNVWAAPLKVVYVIYLTNVKVFILSNCSVSGCTICMFTGEVTINIIDCKNGLLNFSLTTSMDDTDLNYKLDYLNQTLSDITDNLKSLKDTITRYINSVRI